MADEPLSFKEMCATFDVTPRTLRYYEYIELLSPIKEGRARYLRAARTGADDADHARPPLRLLRSKRSANGCCSTTRRGLRSRYLVWIDLANRQLAELEKQRADLDETIRDLKALRDRTAESL